MGYYDEQIDNLYAEARKRLAIANDNAEGNDQEFYYEICLALTNFKTTREREKVAKMNREDLKSCILKQISNESVAIEDVVVVSYIAVESIIRRLV